jgi:mannosyl-oligosaccharide alpha-1,2-mannosidase
MRSLSVRGAAALLLALTGSSAVAAPHQSRAAPRYVTNRQRADAVKDAFQVSWDGYYKYAFPHDSLRPVTNGYADDRCVPTRLPALVLASSLVVGCRCV